MAQILNLPRYPTTAVICSTTTTSYSDRPSIRLSATTHHQHHHKSWTSLRQHLRCDGRFTCLFSNHRKQEEAKKALESALGGKKSEFENWNREIKKRTEAAGGGDGGGGGWFGWGGWFGGNGDHFWQEAQQASLAILGIIVMYLLISKGEVLLAVIFNPLLFALRGTRNGFTFITSRILQKVSPITHAKLENVPSEESYARESAKDSVMKKWGSD